MFFVLAAATIVIVAFSLIIGERGVAGRKSSANDSALVNCNHRKRKRKTRTHAQKSHPPPPIAIQPLEPA